MEAAADVTAAARAALLAAFYQARDTGDAELMAAAALNLPSRMPFGPHPGQVPALIHEAYRAAATPVDRCRLAAALARTWVYGGDARRAETFAAEAIALADHLDDPGITVDALDAALVAHWGPDGFAQRLDLSARLVEAAAHLTEPEPRLSAHLWRLTTAWECLDIVAVQRQLRALEALAEETGAARHAFFATSRRAMHALVIGDTESADRLIAGARDLGAAAGEPDLEAVTHSLAAARARQVGDIDGLCREAAAFETYGAAEGVASVSAEAAVFWLAADEPDRALQLLLQLAGGGLSGIALDVDFLLTVTSLVEVAAALHRRDVAADGVRLLAPFAGRAVLNAGAVTFHGVVDDYLHRAQAELGHADATRWLHNAVAAYQRVGATWWQDRLAAAAPPPQVRTVTAHLHPDSQGGWLVGRDGSTIVMPDLKGLHYLRELLRNPGTDLNALDLSATASGHAGIAVTDSDTADIADRQALAAYRRRLRDIDAELDEAASWTDQGSLDRLRFEREALLDEIRTATGLGGRRRRFSSTNERARVAVRKAIASALDRIDHHDAALARLLRDTIHTGASCRYTPDPGRPVTWLLDPPKTET
ncbi:hypothetical protein [Streptomyces sp. NBC_01530]|uniref:hypothetical protein n=1 Tax=Streptomyces sp. NBC_01530 TaxID=2903895 RepID=UPI00386E73C8